MALNNAKREIFVISDLHIGGRYPSGEALPGDRGFRMCTRVAELSRFVESLRARHVTGVDVELVINGDFIDFLAEESPAGGIFLPFIDDPEEAARRLDAICKRDVIFFDALAGFVSAGGRLTILLGNHDVELSFPSVRQVLLSRLGGSIHKGIGFLYDGEGYAVGDAFIEHGNRYDGFNVIDHDALRRLRSLQSRRQPIPADQYFPPPPGSRLVASIMNPIKRDYPFVDLLKPEVQTVIPILLALEPSYKREALELLQLKRQALRHDPVSPGMPAFRGDIAAKALPRGGSELADLEGALQPLLGADGASHFLAGITDDVKSGDISSFRERGYYGLLRLLTARAQGAVERRLPSLLEALRLARNNQAFNPEVEGQKEYLDAALSLADRGFRYVLFGHTHLAKQVDLGAGRQYLNTGTWADLIKFPAHILEGDTERALAELRTFVADMAARRFAPWIFWKPTYARLELVGDRIVRSELCEFDISGASGL